MHHVYWEVTCTLHSDLVNLRIFDAWKLVSNYFTYLSCVYNLSVSSYTINNVTESPIHQNWIAYPLEVYQLFYQKAPWSTLGLELGKQRIYSFKHKITCMHQPVNSRTFTINNVTESHACIDTWKKNKKLNVHRVKEDHWELSSPQSKRSRQPSSPTSCKPLECPHTHSYCAHSRVSMN